jgi:hypothetical protein
MPTRFTGRNHNGEAWFVGFVINDGCKNICWNDYTSYLLKWPRKLFHSGTWSMLDAFG